MSKAKAKSRTKSKAKRATLHMPTNRIGTYTAWKRKNIDEMLEPITFTVKTMVDELLQTRKKYRASGVSITSVTYALQELQSADQEPDEVVFLEKLPAGFLKDVTGILTDFESSTSLTLVRAVSTLDPLVGEDSWGCKVHLACPPWQQLVETQLGCPADIVIEVFFDDYSPMRVSLPNAPYMELADLLVLRAAADEYWAGPLAWATLRAGGL